jgi:hypothetical protein
MAEPAQPNPPQVIVAGCLIQRQSPQSVPKQGPNS